MIDSIEKLHVGIGAMSAHRGILFICHQQWSHTLL